jgi:hypothetical protein
LQLTVPSALTITQVGGEPHSTIYDRGHLPGERCPWSGSVISRGSLKRGKSLGVNPCKEWRISQGVAVVAYAKPCAPFSVANTCSIGTPNATPLRSGSRFATRGLQLTVPCALTIAQIGGEPHSTIYDRGHPPGERCPQSGSVISRGSLKRGKSLGANPCKTWRVSQGVAVVAYAKPCNPFSVANACSIGTPTAMPLRLGDRGRAVLPAPRFQLLSLIHPRELSQLISSLAPEPVQLFGCETPSPITGRLAWCIHAPLASQSEQIL